MSHLLYIVYYVNLGLRMSVVQCWYWLVSLGQLDGRAGSHPNLVSQSANTLKIKQGGVPFYLGRFPLEDGVRIGLAAIFFQSEKVLFFISV